VAVSRPRARRNAPLRPGIAGSYADAMALIADPAVRR
jgi:hypothetical protein